MISGEPLKKHLRHFWMKKHPPWERPIMVIEDGDAAELAHALGVAAKARGMSEIAKSTGITREALYKALKPNAKPRFDTINKVCAALGVRLVAQPVNPH